MTQVDNLNEQRKMASLGERMLNHWFASDNALYVRYYKEHQKGEVMLANLERRKPEYYEKLRESALVEADGRRR